MVDTSYDKLRTTAAALGKLLAEHNAVNPLVLDLSALNAWTDFFVIATATSSTHMGGLQRHVMEYCDERALEIRRNKGKSVLDEGWNLVDLGSIVVHLMSAQAREFYELERLWSHAEVLPLDEPPQAR